MNSFGSSELILVVEDKLRERRALTLFLEDEGYAVIEADTLAEAGRLLDQRAADISLVVLDVGMPDGDGLEFLERRPEFSAGLPVILNTGQGNIEMAVRAIRLGAFDFMVKGGPPEKIGVTITRALEMARVRRERDELRHDATGGPLLIGESPAMLALKASIAKIAPTGSKVLILGENGTGKELVARLLHEGSPRRDMPFVRVNSAAIPRDLVESELFGHEKGAFTGATAARKGKLELAHRGTLFLDEIGDMGLDAQAKLLRALESGELERIGGQKTLIVDVRLLAATNKDLKREMAEGRFREDLYYRLNVVPLRVPALRERREDIPRLLASFLSRQPTASFELAPSALELLAGYAWPGNVRELRNVAERLAILAEGPRLDAEALRRLLPELDVAGAAPDVAFGAGPAPTMPAGPAAAEDDPDAPADGGTLRPAVEEAERRAIRDAVEAAAGNMTEAARRLGIDRANLYRKIKRYRLGKENE